VFGMFFICDEGCSGDIVYILYVGGWMFVVSLV